MAVITKISPQKNGKRVNIYLDNKFSFGIDLENLVKLGLALDQELSEEKVIDIVKKADFQKTYDKILNFAVRRPRSKKEFDMWLKKYKVAQSLYAKLFANLKKLALLDDKKFAVWWVTQRVQFKNKSKRALKMELRQKGISDTTIEEVLQEENIDEKKMAEKLLAKKSRLWVGLDEFSARRKKSAYLLRNGFSWDVIKVVLE